jgi:dimethylhistidine N-methyltransferase
MATASATKKNLESQNPQRDEFLSDVLIGLRAVRKTLNPKYFYDGVGSRLFERITELPEYYITRTETKMMRQIAADIENHCGDAQVVVEFGSGSGQRSDLLLSGLPNVTQYVPIDVSEELLATTSDVVERAHFHVRVTPLVADFTQKMQLPSKTPERKLGYFPGSTIGNFLPDEAVSFLKNAKNVLGDQSRMLIGVDLTKATERLESAYDDAAGVTAQFNMNVLTRINEELDADFLLRDFEHQAFFDHDLSRIEMHLVSLKNQRVTIDGEHTVNFRTNETIHTENSHKYTIDGFHALAKKSDWSPVTHWVDEERLFSVHLLESQPI